MASGINIQTPSSIAPAALLIPPPAAISSAQSLSQLENRLAQMQDEVNSLTLELSAVRKRDAVFQSRMTRINDEMRLAARLQQDFLPKQLPQLGRVRFHALFRPASYVSGDLYDAMRLDEQHVGFYMADAVGHGVPAALLTMYVKRALVTKEILP
jgi:phosphoserine phosphatase RsbU/P